MKHATHFLGLRSHPDILTVRFIPSVRLSPTTTLVIIFVLKLACSELRPGLNEILPNLLITYTNKHSAHNRPATSHLATYLLGKDCFSHDDPSYENRIVPEGLGRVPRESLAPSNRRKKGCRGRRGGLVSWVISRSAGRSV